MSDMKIKVFLEDANVKKDFISNCKENNLKCPFCQQELRNCCAGVIYTCSKPDSCPHKQCYGSKELWQELIRTRKALDVAVDALKEQQRWFGVIRVSLISHLNNEYETVFKSYDADPTVVNVKRANDILNKALEQITALEQKDVK